MAWGLIFPHLLNVDAGDKETKGLTQIYLRLKVKGGFLVEKLKKNSFEREIAR